MNLCHLLSPTNIDMPTRKSPKPKPAGGATDAAAVAEFMRTLDHPLKPVLAGVRQIILGVDSGISEGIKWNAPSFFYKDYFATTGLRSPDFIHIIFHTGAKIKASATQGIKIADPMKLLEWHAKDRCSIKIRDAKDLAAKKSALHDIVKQWIKQM